MQCINAYIPSTSGCDFVAQIIPKMVLQQIMKTVARATEAVGNVPSLESATTGVGVGRKNKM